MKIRLSGNRIVASKQTAWLLSALVRIYSATFRMTVENEEEWKRHYHNGGIVLLCAWHQQFFSAIRHFDRYRQWHPCVMISRSRDGDIISNVAEQFGWVPVRGSSSQGGAEALKKMVKMLKQNRLAGHIVDGPRGPAGIVKPGVIRMAQASGAAIVPFSSVADKAWFFNSWDKFFIPKPFAKVRLRFHKPIKFNRMKSKETFELERTRLEKIMRNDLLTR